jgi:hypothetical protein
MDADPSKCESPCEAQLRVSKTDNRVGFGLTPLICQPV